MTDSIQLDGYKLAQSVTRFRRADPAKILLSCGLKILWRINVGPYILTLTKKVETS